MIGIEFGAPNSFRLKASWSVLETANKGLFCQLITIPLFKEHKILCQVAGHASHTIKLLPAFVINDKDCDWIVRAFDEVIAGSHRVPGAIWSLGKTLIGHATRSRKPSEGAGVAGHVGEQLATPAVPSIARELQHLSRIARER